MISSLPPSAERFLLDLNRVQERAARAQRQLTTGLKIQGVSDDPDVISRLLYADTRLSESQQTQANLGRVKVEVDTAEEALRNAVSVLDDVRVIGAQAAGTTVPAETRQQLADQLQGRLERMVAIAGTQVEGRYVFAGDKDQAVPYDVDQTTASGVTTYAGSASTRQVTDAAGLAFPIAKDAQTIFDSSDDTKNVFKAITNLRKALLAVDNPPNPPDPTIQTVADALDAVKSAAVYLNTQLSFYGLTQNRVQEATSTAQSAEINYKAQIANIQEADMAAAAVELQQSSINLNAALEAKAKTPRSSLFDFLG